MMDAGFSENVMWSDIDDHSDPIMKTGLQYDFVSNLWPSKAK